MQEYKKTGLFCSDWLSVKSESRGEYSICQPSPPPLFLHACSESEGGGHEEVLTFFGGEGGGLF